MRLKYFLVLRSKNLNHFKVRMKINFILDYKKDSNYSQDISSMSKTAMLDNYNINQKSDSYNNELNIIELLNDIKVGKLLKFKLFINTKKKSR